MYTLFEHEPEGNTAPPSSSVHTQVHDVYTKNSRERSFNQESKQSDWKSSALHTEFIVGNHPGMAGTVQEM